MKKTDFAFVVQTAVVVLAVVKIENKIFDVQKQNNIERKSNLKSISAIKRQIFLFKFYLVFFQKCSLPFAFELVDSLQTVVDNAFAIAVVFLHFAVFVHSQ